MRRAFSCNFVTAIISALPPVTVPRLPIVPCPIGVLLVSPWRTAILLKSAPSSSATIWAKVVSCPCPCGEMPVITVTVPLGSTRTLLDSYGPKPHISM